MPNIPAYFHIKFFQRLKGAACNLLVLVVYVLLARVGLFFTLNHSTITIFWPAGGFALAVLLLGGLKYLPGIFFGGVASAFIALDDLWLACMLGAADALESFIAYYLLTRKFGLNSALETLQDFFKLSLLAGGMASAFSALIGPTALLAGNAIPPELYPAVSLRWWMGDVLGIAFITPLILIWRNSPQGFNGKKQVFECNYSA